MHFVYGGPEISTMPPFLISECFQADFRVSLPYIELFNLQP
jgi:hypothetical protein